jgi:adenine-specific DNA-methyltransferase
MPKKDYSDWSKEDLVKRIHALEKRKRYGLVWDEERIPEIVALECQKKLPVLSEIKEKEIRTNPDQPTHILIEGDNYHALSVLNYTHEKAIDVIYIDPPFNTGSRNWKYNNDYVERDDGFKHSKWISFMYKRLRLVKNLLKEKGIIVVAVDDHEVHALRFIMDEIFHEDNRLGTIVVVNKIEGRTDDKFLPTAHEYMLVYGRNSDYSNINRLPVYDDEILDKYPYEDDISRYQLREFRRGGANSRRQDRPNLYYEVYYSPGTGQISLELENKDSIKILPIDKKGIERCWRWGKQRLMDNVLDIVVTRSPQDENHWEIKLKKREVSARKVTTIWNSPKYNAATHGTKLLEDIIGRNKAFDYPKSIYTLMDSLAITSDMNSIILDFFAGSGTTGDAVLRLNHFDNGKRQFILCTNNENRICEDVCYPRIKNVMVGYVSGKQKDITGAGGNLRYYRTSFVPSEPTDKNRQLLTEQSVEMLTLRENTFDFVDKNDSFIIYKSAQNYTGIIFDQLSIPDFKKRVSNFDKPVNVYIFSLADDDFADEFEDMRNKVKVCSIPESILKVYRRLFR